MWLLLVLLLLLQGNVALHWPLVDSPSHTFLLVTPDVAAAVAVAAAGQRCAALAAVGQPFHFPTCRA
jgi:hypothetical protein